MNSLASLLLVGALVLLFFGAVFFGVDGFLLRRFNGHGPALRGLLSVSRSALVALLRVFGIECSQPDGETPRRQPPGGQGLASTPIDPCTMYPLPKRNPEQPQSIPEIPLGLARTLSRATDEVCRQGPITLQLLNGNPKAIVVPWYGDPDRGAENWDPGRGDGEAHYSEPGCDLWQELPAHMIPENWRIAVPVWVIAAPSPEAFGRGQGEVVLAGHLHPLHNAALVDYYKGGVYQARRYYWDSKINLREIMRINLAERLEALKEDGAFLGPVPLLAPKWQPRQGTAAI